MKRVFAENIAPETGRAIIYGKEAMYITKVLRMKKGETLTILDGQGHAFESTIEETYRREVKVRVNKIVLPPQPSPLYISLAQAFVKLPALDFLLQKTTELGVNEIDFFPSERAVLKINADNLEKKKIRWQEIIKSACKQCGRIVFPTLKIHISFENLVKNSVHENTLKLILWENEQRTDLKDLLKSVPPADHVFVMVGPEGGFTSDEINLAKKNGFKIVSLGRRILRAETAAIALLSILQYEWGDLNLSFCK